MTSKTLVLADLHFTFYLSGQGKPLVRIENTGNVLEHKHFLALLRALLAEALRLEVSS